MADNIQTMIPRYGELNRIYRDYMDNSTFSFDRQKFISDFCQQYNDMKSFEAAILELVLDRQKEQYTLILNSLKTEIEKSIQAYETRPISNSAIERVCHQHMELLVMPVSAGGYHQQRMMLTTKGLNSFITSNGSFFTIIL